MKQVLFFLAVLIVASPFEISAKRIKNRHRVKQSIKVNPRENHLDGNTIIKFDELFESKIDRRNLYNSFDETAKALNSELTKLPEMLRYDIIEHYRASFEKSIENGDEALATDYALKYLCVGGKNESFNYFYYLFEFYADNNSQNLPFILSQLENISRHNGGEYDEQISKLVAEYDDVLNPKTFEESVIGKWVAIDPMGYASSDDDPSWYNTTTKAVALTYGHVGTITHDNTKLKKDNLVNPLVMNIFSVHNNGGILLLNSPLKKWESKCGNKLWTFKQGNPQKWDSGLSQSLFFDGNAETMDAAFCTKKFKNPKTELAKSIRTASYKFQSESEAKIKMSKAPAKEKFKAYTATGVTAAILNAEAEEVSKGYVHQKTLGIYFNAVNDKLMNVVIDYDHIKALSKHDYEFYDRVEKKPNRMVKWEESDSVIFVVDGKPMFAGESLPDDSPLLEEYHKIKYEYRWSKAKYVFPTIGYAVGSAAVGVGLYCLGKWLFDNADSEHEKSDAVHIVYLSPLIGIGLFCELKKGLIDKPRRKAMNREFDERINRPSMQKLRDKASLSISPAVGLSTHSVGINMVLNF